MTQESRSTLPAHINRRPLPEVEHVTPDMLHRTNDIRMVKPQNAGLLSHDKSAAAMVFAFMWAMSTISATLSRTRASSQNIKCAVRRFSILPRQDAYSVWAASSITSERT